MRLRRTSPRHQAADPVEETPLERLTRLLENQRNRWRVWFGIIAILLVAIGANQLRINHVANEATVAAHDAQTAADKAQDAIDLVLAQRTESRLFTCLKDQKFANAHDGLVLYFVAIGEKDPTTEPALIADFKAKNLVPVPDCSPEGIAAFYAGQGGTVAPTMPAAPAPSTTSTTKTPSKHATTTTAPTTSTGRPSTTSTTFRSSPTTTATPCTGVTIPGVGCL